MVAEGSSFEQAGEGVDHVRCEHGDDNQRNRSLDHDQDLGSAAQRNDVCRTERERHDEGDVEVLDVPWNPTFVLWARAVSLREEELPVVVISFSGANPWGIDDPEPQREDEHVGDR